jgi:hypothetical protein
VPGALIGGDAAVVCSVGEAGSTRRCDTTVTERGQTTVVSVGPVDLAARQGLSVQVRFDAPADPAPPDTVRVAPTRAASPPDATGLSDVAGQPPAQPGALVVALVLGPLGLLGGAGGGWLITRRFGRDLRWAGGPADAVIGGGGGHDMVSVGEAEAHAMVTVAFTPPSGVRPGEGGALWRLRAGDDDKVATVVDLAVRGWLTIDDSDIRRPRLVWRGRSADTGTGTELEQFERDLLAGLFSGVALDRPAPSAGNPPVCELGEYSPSFARVWDQLGSALDERLRQRAWLRPGAGQRTLAAAAVGIVGLAMGIGWCALAVMGRWAGATALGWTVVVPGMVIAGAGLGVVAASAGMRARTPAGFSVWAQTEGLRRFMAGSEGSHARDAAERGVLRQYTAWAVALDEVNRWDQACRAAGVDPTAGWMSGQVGLAAGLSALRTGSARAATSPKSSGSSSGSVGGGAGGGGFSSR